MCVVGDSSLEREIEQEEEEGEKEAKSDQLWPLCVQVAVILSLM